MSPIITLPSAGALPGIAGNYAPGTYDVDYVERTATLVKRPEKLQADSPDELPIPVESQHPYVPEGEEATTESDTSNETKQDKKS